MQLCALRNSLNIGKKNDVVGSLVHLIQAILMSRLENHACLFGSPVKHYLFVKNPWFGHMLCTFMKRVDGKFVEIKLYDKSR